MQYSSIDFDFNDSRLESRANFILSRLNQRPGAHFPKAFACYSELEGFYRFVNNSKVTPESLLNSVIHDSLNRAVLDTELLVIHDTTEVCPHAKAKNISEFQPLTLNKQRGFLAHLSLLVEPCVTNQANGKILGAVGLELLTRDPKRIKKRIKKVTEPRESERWTKQALKTDELFKHKNSVIHVMDRESDAYDIIFKLQQTNTRFVIRLTHNRCLLTGDGFKRGGLKLFDALREQPPKTTRSVQLSARKAHERQRKQKAHPPRAARTAKLEISAMTVVLKRGDRFPLSLGYPPGVKVNVVRVFEPHPPDGEVPVEWYLCTSDKIDSAEDLEKIVNIYKSRWIIEEFFKALKTGCNLERRLLESAEAWYRILILFLPIARNLYNLKLLSEHTTLDESCDIFSITQILVLKHLAKMQSKPMSSLGDAKRELARLGGHISYVGPPGWLVLSRGYLELVSLEYGWIAARTAICD